MVITSMKDIEILKEEYYHQIQQKQQINTNASIPIGILGLIIGGYVYLINNLNDIPYEKLFIMFTVLCIFSGCVLFNCYFLIRVLWRNQYSYLETAQKRFGYKKVLEKHYDDNETWYKKHKYPFKEHFVEEKFEKYLCEKYVECIDQNFETNKKRICYLRKASTCLVVTLIVGCINLLIYTGLSPGTQLENNNSPIYMSIDTIHINNVRDVLVNTKESSKEVIIMPNNDKAQENKDEIEPVIPEGPGVINLLESFNDKNIEKAKEK